MVWNCQGAASKRFKSVLKTFIVIHNLGVLMLIETRISGFKAELLIRTLKFHHSHRVEALGDSGGIWILWNNDWSIWVIQNHRQYVHLEVWDDCRFNFLFTPVYGSPQTKNRLQLWNDLNDIASTVRGPWVVARDFNAILHKDEKCGGS